MSGSWEDYQCVGPSQRLPGDLTCASLSQAFPHPKQASAAWQATGTVVDCRLAILRIRIGTGQFLSRYHPSEWFQNRLPILVTRWSRYYQALLAQQPRFTPAVSRRGCRISSWFSKQNWRGNATRNKPFEFQLWFTIV